MTKKSKTNEGIFYVYRPAVRNYRLYARVYCAKNGSSRLKLRTSVMHSPERYSQIDIRRCQNTSAKKDSSQSEILQ